MDQIIQENHSTKKKIVLVIGIIIGLSVLLIVLLFITRQKKEARVPTGEPPRVEEVPRPAADPIPNDRDRDGLTNEEEAAAGTSETEFDTDYDGVSDIDEIRSWKTDPKKFDTDGDGFGDGVEIIRGFNPRGPGKL